MSEYARRRRQLMRTVGEDAAIVLPSARLRLRNGDADYRFRQDSDFHYLTGFSEPDAVLVLAPGRKHGAGVLFCNERDPKREVWDGPRAGQQGAVKTYGMDDSFPIGDIDEILPGLIEGRERVYYTIGQDSDFDQRMMGWVNQLRKQVGRGAHPPEEFISLAHALHDMRLYKNRAEIVCLRRAANIAADAHRRAMEQCRPGLFEYQVEAELQYVLRQNNSEPSYTPIVAGGTNACILHYIENHQELKDGDLLLIDAGAEYDCYASDITRTFPVNGRYSDAQRALYDVVLEAQLDSIDAVAPGRGYDDFHHAAVKTVTRGLIRLGIIDGPLSKAIKEKRYEPYFMHKTGHWLGLDVHDVGDYQVDDQPRELEAGMVVTVEPGVYIPPRTRGVDAKWRGIGIRIEDDVAVTSKGNDVLSKKAAKDPDEIERIMSS